MNIQIKKVRKDAKLPTRGSDYAAGYDLYATKDYFICQGMNEKIPVGVAVKIPDGYFGGIFARSGLATKRGLRPSNCTGVIDSDYTGEIIVSLYNDTDKIQIVKAGERIAQLVVIPYASVEFEEVEELEKTKRGDGGFGSTGS